MLSLTNLTYTRVQVVTPHPHQHIGYGVLARLPNGNPAIELVPSLTEDSDLPLFRFPFGDLVSLKELRSWQDLMMCLFSSRPDALLDDELLYHIINKRDWVPKTYRVGVTKGGWALAFDEGKPVVDVRSEGLIEILPSACFTRPGLEQLVESMLQALQKAFGPPKTQWEHLLGEE